MKRQSNPTPKFLDKKDIIIRHAVILLLALLFTFTGIHEERSSFLQATLSQFILIGLIWNGNILLDNIAAQFYTLEYQLKQRLFITIIIALTWPVAASMFYNMVIFPIIYGFPCNLTSKENITYIITSISVTLLINTIFIAIAFFKFWRQSIKEKEELKRESLLAEFETLKNQINPHFLFNALNTLTGLIEEEPKVATDFVQKLSNVFRYVLTQKDKQTVSIEEEIQFIKAYVYLSKIRFGANISFEINIPIEYYKKQIVTLASQMLIENALKHNVISAEHPLTVEVKIVDEKLMVRNNYQPKQLVESSNGIGLTNIVHRYGFLTDDAVEIKNDEQFFAVYLPLLNMS
ncbi:MAG: histidine kinase [Bacteroidia bacterium]|jgi:sensor histidine kinase YesM|nr:histidine kinase [Bacteroidia bacterium]